ncbi:polysaccharide biosynthesis/export family protein [Rubellicoccus peritrichatus]|uniref:Polysaccharide biosynthesis/export family protein n=1 Tax=Rubellicoccus peritrichatus TaxID=3080537 RepID=A0AAQ3QS58_9BACT|nr:polysaccharide biosynthesis/export family protein [Puniceicoccus sp. CR14]WOO40006.1 polysaccharide biosynthesis/export family protein [Puniceicoccus sp. CR14]
MNTAARHTHFLPTGGMLFRYFLVVFALLAIVGCETTDNGLEELPKAPKQAAVLRSGDGIEVLLQGIPDPSVNEVQIDDQGYISLPYIGKVRASGLAPSELAADIRKAYVDQKIYRSVDISVRVTDRFVYVGGEVANPGRVIWTPDLTFLKAIQSAGGFSLYAREGAVQLSRDQQTYQVDADKAQNQPQFDPKLYPGDSINVPRSPF